MNALSSKNIEQKHTTGGIPRWSPTLVLVARFSAYVWQSGRDAQFSLTCGRLYLTLILRKHITGIIRRALSCGGFNICVFMTVLEHVGQCVIVIVCYGSIFMASLSYNIGVQRKTDLEKVRITINQILLVMR
jgi:endonuclease V-like protein UPF0215 family